MEPQTPTNFFSTYITRENITLAIAVFGALGTIASWISNFYHTRKNIGIQIIKISRIKNSLIAYVSFQNKSQLPISINSISIQVDGKSYSGCAIPPHTIKITKQTGNAITGTREYQSIPFPVNLGSLSGASGYIFFDTSKSVVEALSSPLTVLVSTNRGKSMKMKLPWTEWTDWDKMF
ncbi:MAG: hypothetical protein K2P25_02280 [Lachnospiraceae bacterium]|nr:hypothetical protein [Lachnospiraceae bacterium]